MISIVIPHKGRDSLLTWQLNELRHQSFSDFEIIVVHDMEREESGSFAESILINNPEQNITIAYSGGSGPAHSRNIGGQMASSDIVLFVGSDCIPHKHLVAEHYLTHLRGADIVQGYTPWHPDVQSPFHHFIDESGLQAAWNNLKDDDGKWMVDISPSFCLTTNYSISRQLFLNERFDTSFSSAAWEDVEFGYRLSKYQSAIKAVFNPRAVNYHYHRYDFDSFLKRSYMEGYHRLTICKLHPEMSWNMVNPEELRGVKDLNEVEIVNWAKELDSVNLDSGFGDVDDLGKMKYQRYHDACKVFSLKGVLARIKDEHPAMEALKNVHKAEQVIQIISGVTALEKGHYGYAAHAAQWFVTERTDDWSAYAFLGEVELAMGNKLEAIDAFRDSTAINPGEEWPKKRLAEIMS